MSAPADPIPRSPIHVHLDRPEEVAYWIERLGCDDEDELREAVEVAGNKLMKVHRYLAVMRGAS
jgi:hypothetical protein